MTQKYFLKVHTILILCLLFQPFFILANVVPATENDPIILAHKNKKSDKMCGEQFYINDLDIELSSNGYLTVSLNQFSKTTKGFVTFLAIELLDMKGRVLTVYETPTLTLRNGKEKNINQNYYFSENFKHQFTAEEFKIFINNVKQIKVNYKGCNEPNLTAERDLLRRKLPTEIVEEFIHKAPLVSE